MNKPGNQLFGVSAALATPFNKDLSIDYQRMADHAASLLVRGCSSVTLFGTTGEGASLTDPERIAAHQALLESGIEASQIVVCISSSVLKSATDQARIALQLGCSALLVLPPFYFKGVSDDGLFDWYSGLIDDISSQYPRIILYHIPQVTGVGISRDLICRLKEQFGEVVFAVKDSAGHWLTTYAFLTQSDIAVIVGDERYLAAATRIGAVGAISGVANFLPELVLDMVQCGNDNKQLKRLINTITQFPVVAAVKSLTGHKRGEQGWAEVRSPLVKTPVLARQRLSALLDEFQRKKAG